MVQCLGTGSTAGSVGGIMSSSPVKLKKASDGTIEVRPKSCGDPLMSPGRDMLRQDVPQQAAFRRIFGESSMVLP